VNKSELIDALASRLNVGKREAQETLDEILDAITRAVVAGEKVAFTGFGIFEKVERGARTARNPRTGATVKVRKTSVAKFRPGADLKAFVSGAKKLPRATAPAAPAKAAAPAKKAPAKKAPARKAATKAAPAKSTAAKRTAAKRTTAKRTTAKRTTAKRTTTAAPARRTTAKKAAPARTVRKAAPAKRAVAKKAPARRTAR
jgi:DNA-binding protein HU-beta